MNLIACMLYSSFLILLRYQDHLKGEVPPRYLQTKEEQQKCSMLAMWMPLLATWGKRKTSIILRKGLCGTE